MPFDYAFDPETQDLIDDGKGNFVLTEHADTAMQEALLAHYKEWPGDPDLGSLLHQLDRFKGDPANLVPDEVKRALGRLVSTGRIDQLESVAEEAPGVIGRVNVLTRARDTTSDQQVDVAVQAGG